MYGQECVLSPALADVMGKDRVSASVVCKLQLELQGKCKYCTQTATGIAVKITDHLCQCCGPHHGQPAVGPFVVFAFLVSSSGKLLSCVFILGVRYLGLGVLRRTYPCVWG